MGDVMNINKLNDLKKYEKKMSKEMYIIKAFELAIMFDEISYNPYITLSEYLLEYQNVVRRVIKDKNLNHEKENLRMILEYIKSII